MNHFEDQIERLLADDSFVRWIEEEASAKEASQWQDWLHGDPVRKKLVEEAKTLHSSFRFKPGDRPDMEAELSKLHRSIDKSQPVKNRPEPPLTFIHRQAGYYKQVAAVIVLLFAVLTVISLLYYAPGVQEEATPSYLATHTDYGQKKMLTLFDGSTITLNAHSSLRYPASYRGDDLEVWLEGEAYFEIVHKTGDERRTFAVHTPDGKVEVLGTKFNVNTYREGTEVVLEQGKIRVEQSDTLSRQPRTHIMMPGELSRLVNSAESIQVRNIQPELFTSWTRDKLIFDHTPLIQVARRIEDIYGVEFPVTDPQIRQLKISGSVPNDNLPVLLKALGKMLNRPVVNEKGTIRLEAALKN